MTDPLESLRTALEGRYTVERLIGQGGMASVYLARDSRHDRPVAIKVLRPELAVSIGSDRFLREIQVAAHLQHPHILGLYDSGDAAGFLYYVMPFVEGESLRGRLDREGQLSLQEAIQLTCEVSDALQYAHNRRIVHRDIKPENILIQEGHALVADFGIARAVSQAGGDKLTETGMAVGTPHYMSPEQGLGGNQVDGRSDLYSVACVFYEMLVGQPPFDGPNAMAIIARHSMETVPSLQVVRQSIPDEIEDAVLRALEKTPADRFASVQEFAEALCQVDLGPTSRRNSHRSIQAVRRTTPRSVAAPRRHSRKRSLALAAAAVAVLAGASWGAWQHWHRAPLISGAVSGDLDPHRIAVRYFTSEGQGDSLRYVADGLTEGLIRELAAVPTLDVISRNGVAPYRGVDVSRDSMARALRVGTLVEGDVRREGSGLRVTVRLVDGASGAEVKRASFERPAGDLLTLRDSLTQAAAQALRELLGDEVRLREQRAGTRNVSAWLLVQRAEQARKLADSLAQTPDSLAMSTEFERADTLLSRAQGLDPGWAEPLVGRANLAYRRSRLVGADPLLAGPWIARGLKFADQAVQLDPKSADALELRGTLQYWRYLLGVADPLEKRRLLTSAKDNLEQAVRISPAQAGAWGTLSHLYNQTSESETDAKLAAQRAYEADAYLSNADVILWRLFLASFDLGQFNDAAHWCNEGARRFPSKANFAKCQLWLMTSRAAEPDVGRAWRLVDSAVALAPASTRTYEQRYNRMILAGVLARANLPDSARHVAQAARGDGDIDPAADLAFVEAFVRTRLGDKDEAIRQLKFYLTRNPDRRSGLAEDPGWWFRDLANDPRFKNLVGAR